MAKTHTITQRFFLPLASLSLLTQLSYGQGDTLKDDLVSYWPLDEVQGNKTPDLASGFDLVLQNMDASNLVSGQAGMGFSFDSSLREHLVRTHDPADDLPAIKNDSFTIAFWTKTTGTGQSDLRLFSEGSSTNGNPLFTMGTVPGGGTSLDVFIRENGSFNVNHV
ncbi:hypothetical protein N9Z40_03940, partial [Akkermansiaceae bacterium]|nr:hypothetical protein [Akkermansiaceae bacterium]